MKQTDFQFIDGWKLRETEWKPEEESAKATVFALANGYMGSRGAFEEADPTEPGVVGNYINGIYDTPLGKLTEREIVNIPDWHHITLDVDGERFDMRTGEVLDYWRELDMREGILRRRVKWKSPSGKVVTIETERLLSMVRPNVAAVRYAVSAEQECEVLVCPGIREDTNQRWAAHARRQLGFADNTRVGMRLDTFDPGYSVQVMNAYVFDAPISSQPDHRASSEAAQQVYRAHLDTEGVIKVVCYAAIHDSRYLAFDFDTDSTLPNNGSRVYKVTNLNATARESLVDVSSVGYDALKAEHIARWAELWDRADVVIEGDEDAQLGIRFSLFHLLAAAPWWSDRVSMPARGLQGQDYYGSIFWDFEIFVFPFLAATWPEAARNGVGYRYHTLNGARRKANNYGFDGAFYAWQSQETGDDQCALYVFTNPFTGRPMRAPFSDQQIHISADIVYALWQYWLNTRDYDLIRDRGLEIACEVARFFAVRADRDEAGDYHLRGVLGPDEYHEDVSDNAYTNALVRRAFDVALYFHGLVSDRDPESVAALKRKIRLTDEEVGSWKVVRDNLYVPRPNEQGVIEQFEGFFDLEDAPIDVVRARLAHPDLHPGGPLGPFQSTQVSKQADVVMMLYLLRDQYSPDVKRANWDYYEPRTSHDSSLSPMAYSLVAADVGMTDWAYKYFIHTSHIDLASYGPHWNLGIHAAGLGGAWLALVHGFCQVSQEEDALLLRAWPALPEQWRRVQFQVIQARQRLRFSLEGGGVTVEHLGAYAGDDAPATVRHPDGERALAPGETTTLR